MLCHLLTFHYPSLQSKSALSIFSGLFFRITLTQMILIHFMSSVLAVSVISSLPLSQSTLPQIAADHLQHVCFNYLLIIFWGGVSTGLVGNLSWGIYLSFQSSLFSLVCASPPSKVDDRGRVCNCTTIAAV